MWPPAPWQGSHSSPESLSICLKTVIKARTEGGLGEVPAREASEAAWDDFSAEVGGGWGGGGSTVGVLPEWPVWGRMKLPGVLGSMWPTEQAHGSCSYLLQKPGNRRPGLAFVCRLLQAWTGALPTTSLPHRSPQGTAPGSKVPLRVSQALYTKVA